MNLLWKEDRPLSRTAIIEMCPKTTWRASSIHILLNSLLGKGAIYVAGFEKTGTHYGRTFAEQISEAEYAAMQITGSEAFKASSTKVIKSVVRALLDAEDSSEETISELERLLEEKKRKIKSPSAPPFANMPIKEK